MEGRWDRCLWLGYFQGRSFEGTLVRHKLDGWDLGASGVRTPQKGREMVRDLGQQWGWRLEFGIRQRNTKMMLMSYDRQTTLEKYRFFFGGT